MTVNFTTWKGITDGQTYGIPDSEDLHSRYDFSEEDGSLPVTDLSENGHDLDNGDYTGVAEDINGVQAGEFDGVDDGVWTSVSTVSEPITVAFVADINSDDTFQRAVKLQDGPDGDLRSSADPSGDWEIESEGDDIQGGDVFDKLVIAHFDGGEGVLRVNGTEVANGDTPITMDGINIGSRQIEDESSGYFEGAIGEVLIYDSNKSDIFDDIESYLSDKWGISI